LDNNTLVFFISDNGGPPFANTSSNHPLAGSKGTVWEGGIRVPFVVRWPGHVPAGAIYEQPVISLDISATAAAAAGVKLGGEQPIDGVNLLPYITGQDKNPPHASLYWRFGPQWAVRQGNYKLTKTADSDRPALFDLSKDISEQHDLASAEPQIVSKLQQTYDGWNRQLAEPRWEPARRANGKQRTGKQRGGKRTAANQE
jgi:arylsulfatase A-like enzyme